MDPRGTKFFDVARPSQVGANATSRPIIVGHRPMMPDPMMRREAPKQNDPTLPQIKTHKAKIIEISDDIKNEITQATTEAEPPKPVEVHEPDQPVEVPPDNPASPVESAGIGEVPAEHLPLPVTESPAVPHAADGQPAPEPNSDDPQRPPQPAAETLVPTPDLSHIPHVPVSHSYPSGNGKLKNIMVWSAVVLVLFGFGIYLAIDAGLVGSSVHLPVHIFSRQA